MPASARGERSRRGSVAESRTQSPVRVRAAFSSRAPAGATDPRKPRSSPAASRTTRFASRIAAQSIVRDSSSSVSRRRAGGAGRIRSPAGGPGGGGDPLAGGGAGGGARGDLPRGFVEHSFGGGAGDLRQNIAQPHPQERQ